jgi:DNA-directed RNA polymerase subunit L
MPVKVKNSKIDTITFDKKNYKDFDKCVEFVKLIDPDYKKHLPTKPIHKVQFELTDTTVDFANCIRRYLLDEIMVYSMDVDESHLVTDDKFILSDVLKKQIELIPFQQKITQSDIDDLQISISFENKTDDLMQIYSRHITITDKKNKKLDTEKYFSLNIPLIKVRPNKSMELKNITIVSGCGKQDSGKFCLLSNLSYEILDVVPFDESKFGKEGKSSLNSDPQHFRISYKTHRNIEPKKIMLMCCDAITKSFSIILKELSNIKNSDNVYFSDLLDLESKGDMKLFHFKNEYWTIANIIARYCYIEFKDIKFVCSCIIHPSIEESIVKIKHTEPVKIISAAIKQILADTATVKKSFT